MAWPKMIEIGAMRVPVDSWDEVREAFEMFGGSAAFTGPEQKEEHGHRRSGTNNGSGLSPTDRSLLEQFTEAGDRGVLTGNLGHALGKRGKGVRPALEAWSRRVGLVTETGASAFEPVKRFDGRGFKMVDHYIRAATQMLGR